jgi:hypothetical protein
MSIEKQTIEKLQEAYEKMEDAALQSHYGHSGLLASNCPECIRAYRIREQADKIFNSAMSLYRESQC